ncbi:MAG TPA: putative sulfate/molybdate transporter [Lentimicrobium sp.]|nr:putative sulfate/molybdate transporter [Lentimicrobium sp.]
MQKTETVITKRIAFNRNEISGAFGDIGTDLPLLVGMILASGLNSAYVLIAYGLMHIMTGLVYGIPMSVQPLKAVAMIVIAQQIAPETIYGAGLAIGAVMLLLTITGLVDLIAKYIPKVVVRGIQFGLGLQLSMIALKQYVLSDALTGIIIAIIAFVTTLLLIGNRKYPPALFVILLGVGYAVITHFDLLSTIRPVVAKLPTFHVPGWSDILTGFLLLALPQIPLSIGNSIIATQRITADLFPEKKLTVSKISLTYSIMNLINPFIGGLPVCHGSGGIAGHYAFGARTGGSVMIYGSIFLLTGLFFSSSFQTLVNIFPLPVLGVILLFEGLWLMMFIKDIIDSKKSFFIALLTALMAAFLPYGYLIGMVSGTILYYISDKTIKSYLKIP